MQARLLFSWFRGSLPARLALFALLFIAVVVGVHVLALDRLVHVETVSGEVRNRWLDSISVLYQPVDEVLNWPSTHNMSRPKLQMTTLCSGLIAEQRLRQRAARHEKARRWAGPHRLVQMRVRVTRRGDPDWCCLEPAGWLGQPHQ